MKRVSKSVKPILVVVLGSALACAQAALRGSPVTGDVPPLSFQSEPAASNAASNFVLGSVSASATADDNINNSNNSSAHPINGVEYYLGTNLAIQQTRSHLKWNLGYSPGLRLYVPQTATAWDQLSHSFGNTLAYQATKRLSIRLREDYLRTTDPFQQLGDAPLQPGISPFERPGNIGLPQLQRTSLLSDAEVNYRIARHTSFGSQGHFVETNYESGNTQHQNLINSQNTAGSAFLTQQVSAHQSLGLQYQFANLQFPQGQSHTQTQSILLFDQFAITPCTTLSIFAGPEHSRINGQVLVNPLFSQMQIPGSQALWTPAVGSTFNWAGEHTGIQASVVRRVGEGGGFVGSVEMNAVTMQIRKKLTRRWNASVTGDFVDDRPLQVAGYKMQTLDAGVGMDHELTRNMSVRIGYQRMRRTGYLSGLGFGNHNRLTVTVQRGFSLPLGR